MALVAGMNSNFNVADVECCESRQLLRATKCLRDTPADTTSTSFLLNAVLSLKCGVRKRRHLQHHAKTADHVISVNAFICVYSTLSLSLSPKITMHPAYRCARLRPSDAVVKNNKHSKKKSEDLFTICITYTDTSF